MGGCTGKTQTGAPKKLGFIKSLPQDNLICGICLDRYDLDAKNPYMICNNQHNAC